MRIGIIGAGHIGGSLTRRLAALGHDVKVANSRDPETLAELAAETGATPVWAADAATDADLVIVSIPQRCVPDLAPGIVAKARDGAPVIETNNYYPRERDGRIDAIEDGLAESVWVSQQLGVPVYKVFNGIFWKHLLTQGAPKGAEKRIALPIAGAPGAGKDTVFALVDELGFDPVDGGSLEESWRQQPGTPVYGTDLDAAGVTKALAETPSERPEQFRAA
ncbi:NAD(P)-binding domain-containing protein [Pseudonocardia ailaonensis]|uniref:NAD(P)-binding domain-containing protein n=1 Tax=Pseudonocardia ailaonensis TaxID=367279 RepID=A0ABN2NLM0_9PSEU